MISQMPVDKEGFFIVPKSEFRIVRETLIPAQVDIDLIRPLTKE